LRDPNGEGHGWHKYKWSFAVAPDRLYNGVDEVQQGMRTWLRIRQEIDWPDHVSTAHLLDQVAQTRKIRTRRLHQESRDFDSSSEQHAVRITVHYG
jgi:hypothetical protein